MRNKNYDHQAETDNQRTSKQNCNQDQITVYSLSEPAHTTPGGSGEKGPIAV